MKKILKWLLIIIGIIVGLLALAWGGMYWKLTSELKHFHPLETGKVVDSIYAVKDDFANIFIVQDSSQYIVFDCANDAAAVMEEMKKLEINPDDVVDVFLTHTDSDHIGALGLFPHAKLYMSKDEENMINGQNRNSSGLATHCPAPTILF